MPRRRPHRLRRPHHQPGPQPQIPGLSARTLAAIRHLEAARVASFENKAPQAGEAAAYAVEYGVRGFKFHPSLQGFAPNDPAWYPLYAAIEERSNPALRGLPLVVGADPKGGRGRGVVMTANYQARRFGIRSALPVSRAWRLADAARRRGEPETIFVRSNFQLYETVSSRIMQIFERFSDAHEEASIDEAYLDISSLKSFDDAQIKMATLKNEIHEQEGLGCSIGIGPNKLIATATSAARLVEARSATCRTGRRARTSTSTGGSGVSPFRSATASVTIWQ